MFVQQPMDATDDIYDYQLFGRPIRWRRYSHHDEEKQNNEIFVWIRLVHQNIGHQNMKGKEL